MELSRRGICYNLSKSPYSLKYRDIVFYFSSNLYLTKFKEKLEDFIDDFNYTYHIKFNIDVDFGELASLILYQKIEKRGFYIVVGGVNECQKLDGAIRIINKLDIL